MLGQNRQHCIHDFLSANFFHAAKIDWAFAEKTGAAFDVMSQDDVTIAERPSQSRFSGAKDGDYWHAQQCGKMHRAGIVGKQQTASPQLVDKFIQRSMADPIYAMIADRSRDLLAYRRVVLRSEQNPLR